MDTLYQSQQQALANSQFVLSQYEAIASEYETLKANLEELVVKTKHEVLAPVCHNMASKQAPIAYAPGFIDHTNQVLVLLGCNWFAERSVHQAREIIGRRLKWLEERRKTVQEEIDNIRKWSEFTGQMAREQGELVEIFEEYSEEEEKKWREKHKERVKVQKEKERLERLLKNTKELSLKDSGEL